MSMHNPPHPGDFIREVYLEPTGINYRTVALKDDATFRHGLNRLRLAQPMQTPPVRVLYPQP
jgi:hypothetical protein